MRSKKKESRLPALFAVLFFLSLCVAAFLGRDLFHKTKPVAENPKNASYMALLTEQEQREWEQKEPDFDHMYVQMNQAVKVDGQGRASLHLVHPLYSAYDCRVKILSDKKELLYDSESLAPGTVVEEAELTKSLVNGSHKATAVFQYTDQEENEIYTYEWTLSLEVS